MIPNELAVTWTHDKMRVVLPVWRERSPLWFAMAVASAIAVVWLGAAYLLGALAVALATFPDRRRVVLEIDAHSVMLRHRVLFRERVERLPIHTVALSGHTHFVLTSGEQTFSYNWTGSKESLLWLQDQIQHARERAGAPAELPPLPAELSRLRRAAQSGQSPANTTSGSSITPV